MIWLNIRCFSHLCHVGTRRMAEEWSVQSCSLSVKDRPELTTQTPLMVLLSSLLLSDASLLSWSLRKGLTHWGAAGFRLDLPPTLPWLVCLDPSSDSSLSSSSLVALSCSLSLSWSSSSFLKLRSRPSFSLAFLFSEASGLDGWPTRIHHWDASNKIKWHSLFATLTVWMLWQMVCFDD